MKLNLKSIITAGEFVESGTGKTLARHTTGITSKP